MVRQFVSHELCHAPQHAQKYKNGKWDKSAAKQYQQYTCATKGCKREIRTYCSYDPANWMCLQCHQKHIIAIAMGE